MVVMDELKQSLTEAERRNARQALLRAVAISGSQVRLAASIQVTQQAISKWLQKDGLVPGAYVALVEAATGVSRHCLRPDIYPVEVPHAPPAWHGVDHGSARDYFQNGGISQRDSEVGAAA